MSRLPHWRMPALDISKAKKGDVVLCTNGAGTGFLRRGKRYTIAEISPSGYVQMEGSADYFHAGARFTAATSDLQGQGCSKFDECQRTQTESCHDFGCASLSQPATAAKDTA